MLRLGRQDVPVFRACPATCRTCALPTTTSTSTTSSTSTATSSSAALCKGAPDSDDCRGLANLCASDVKFAVAGAVKEARLVKEACPVTCNSCAGDGNG